MWIVLFWAVFLIGVPIGLALLADTIVAAILTLLILLLFPIWLIWG